MIGQKIQNTGSFRQESRNLADGYLLIYPDKRTNDIHTNWILGIDDTNFELWESGKTKVFNIINGTALSEDLSNDRYPDGGDRLSNMEVTRGAPKKKIK